MDPIYEEAIARCRELIARAGETDLVEPAAATLATSDGAGRVSARTVLVKALDARGFVFYTNARSRKAHQMRENPRVALLFFWQTIFEQIEVEGMSEPVPEAESDAYWATRPRESQLGAWASDQSEVLPDRALLEERLSELERRFEGRPVPRPPYWHGYRVRPDRIELWHARPHRLHERECYLLEEGRWSRVLLYP